MLISTIFSLILIAIIIGYSFLFKFFFNNQKVFKVNNIDFIYGIFLILILSLFLNFFLPLEKTKILISIVGLFLFIFSFYKKKLNINFLIILFFTVIFSFFTYWNGNNADSPVYHLQTINWIKNYKITFGLAILDWHYALNSVWHIFIAQFAYKFDQFDSIYIINFIPFIFLFSEIFSKTVNKNSISVITLILCSGFLLIFSIIHPYKNGIIFNHFGNPDVDTIGMSFFIISGYLYLKFLENENSYNLNLLIISSLICSLIKLSYLGVLFFPISIIFFKSYKEILISKISFIGSLFISFWVVRNYILSSCLVFPIKLTCFKTNWSLSNEQVSFYLNQTKSFARDTRLREKYTDFDHTIYSYDWFLPWIKDYFFNDAFLIIVTIIFTLSIFLHTFLFLTKKNKIFNYSSNNILKHSLILFLINFIIWFQSPEIRFGWGILIFFPCLILVLILNKINYFSNFKGNLNILILILSLGLCVKNSNQFNIDNIFKPYSKNFNYDQIKIYKNINGIKIFRSLNWMCADFNEICINKPKRNYLINIKKGYLIISTSDFKTL